MKFQSGHGVDEGRHVIGEDGMVYVKQGGSLQSANLTHAEEERVKAMMAIRDASKAVVDLQVGNGNDAELEKLQADLDDKYRKFVKSNGPLSTPINHDLMDKDPDAPFLRALEDNSVYKKDKKDLNEADQYLMKVLEGKLPVKDEDFAKIQMPVFNQRIIRRPYQVEANTAIEQAIEARHRKMMVTMATGTGKTLMTVNEIYRLMKSGVARRVLFLVDRRALAAQTVRAFASFEAEPGLKFDKVYPVYSQRFQKNDFDEDEKFDPNVMPNSLLTNPKLGDAFVYVSTIQRMSINLFGKEAGIHFGEGDTGDEDASKLDIPIHAFDLIVADECHRGYSSKELSVWRNTLDWFDAIKIGLTATPAAHTIAYFEDMVYRYEYERAVREGYLVDYDVVRINSDVRLNGIFLHEGEHVDQVDPGTGTRQLDLLEDERAFDTSQVERNITAPDSNRKILEEIKRYADEHESETGRFPKTLIFAVNDLPHTSHADQLVYQARAVFERGEAFVGKITGRSDRPLQKIREFRNRPNPKVVVTVDLLTTGVDIPNLEFLVFLRPVKSRILFEQMLGRGTRRSPDLVPGKDHFVVFDCFDGTLFEYFRSTTGMTVEPPEGDGKPVEQIVEEIWQNTDREYNTRRLVRRLQRIDKNMGRRRAGPFRSLRRRRRCRPLCRGVAGQASERFQRHDEDASQRRISSTCSQSIPERRARSSLLRRHRHRRV